MRTIFTPLLFDPFYILTLSTQEFISKAKSNGKTTKHRKGSLEGEYMAIKGFTKSLIRIRSELEFLKRGGVEYVS